MFVLHEQCLNLISLTYLQPVGALDLMSSRVVSLLKRREETHSKDIEAKFIACSAV